MSSPSPLLAVIIPVYKVEPYLRQCLDSVCGQTYTNLKIILVDDGSPDASGAICDEYAARDPRITVIHQENGGPSKARNAGLRLVEDCPYFTFLDSDDWLVPDIYAQCVDIMETDSALDIVQFSYHKLGPGVDEIVSAQDIQLLTREIICGHLIYEGENAILPSACNKVFRTSVCGKVTFQEGHFWEDIVYVMEVLYLTKKVQLLSKVGFYYRVIREGSTTYNYCTADLSALYVSLEYLIRRRKDDPLFVGYANALLVNQLWSYWFMLAHYPEAYHRISPNYVPFAKRARKRPLLDFYPSKSLYYKRLLFLYFPKLCMDLYAWRINRRRISRKS